MEQWGSVVIEEVAWDLAGCSCRSVVGGVEVSGDGDVGEGGRCLGELEREL